MPRSMMGLLAAVDAIMAALVGFAHGDLLPVVIAGSGAAADLATYLAGPSKKLSNALQACMGSANRGGRFAARFGPGLWPGPRRQARWTGRGLRGQGWILKIVSAKLI